jgi:tetratricopeptide (TPR) repeat protein
MSDLRQTQPDSNFPPNYARDGAQYPGGMGVVYEARDLRLDRVVAVKLLRAEFPADGPHAALFQAESRLTAQLQHPGIPPVHEAGVMANGRPYMVMKLIKGKTLRDILAACNARAGREAELPNLLDVFESVVKTVAYAHYRGVNHLDLKPGNVMVGKFGEAQVLDWGIATVAQAPAGNPNEFTIIHPPTDTSPSSDPAGTPAYMAPEQAIPEPDQIGPQSDVFGLGAILCELLTGYPPYVADNVHQLLRFASAWRIAPALERLGTSGADPELVAIATKCLAQHPKDRYADADALGKELARWRAAVSEAAKRAEIDAEKKRASEAAAERAERLSRLALTGFNELLFRVQRKLARRAGTLDLQQHILGVARDGLQQLVRAAEQPGTPARSLVWAHFQMGDVLLELNDVIGAQREFEAAHALARQQMERDPNDGQALRDLSVSFNKLGDVVARGGQLARAHELYTSGLQIVESLARMTPADTTLQRDLSVSYNRLSDVLLRLRNPELARGYSERALAVARKQTPELVPGPITGAESEAVRDLSVSIEKLGDVLRRLSDDTGACALYAESLDLRERLAAGDSDNVQARRDLGVSLGKLGGVLLSDPDRERALTALDYFRRAFDVFKVVAEAEPNDAEAQRDYSVGYNQLGDALAQLGNRQEAVAEYERAVEIRRTLNAAQPGDVQTQRDLIVSLFKIGNAYQQLNSFGRASDSYQEGLNLIRASGHPDQFAEENDLFETRLAICKFHLKKNPPPA